MLVLIEKANSDFWYDFKEFISFEDLINFKEQCEHQLILGSNFFYKENIEKIKRWCEIQDDEKAKLINQCKYKITIYNDYIE